MALENQLVRKLAEKHKKTPAQILLRHLIQRGICVIPKSNNAERIHENYQANTSILRDEQLNAF